MDPSKKSRPIGKASETGGSLSAGQHSPDHGISSSDPTMIIPGSNPARTGAGHGPVPDVIHPAAAGSGYEVRGELGRGGFARVYLVREGAARRDVAMKVLAEDQGPVSPESRERFVEEALVTAQLQHPGVVPVYRVGRDETGRDYYTMRPIEGLTLEAILGRLRQGDVRAEAGFPLARLARVFLSVCQTASFAHDRGVVHRDLKPANVVIGSYGEVLVIDWGLAKVLGAAEAPPAQPRPPMAGEELTGSAWERFERRVESLRHSGGSSLLLTADGALAGTPLYMAPEQLRGRSEDIRPHTDVWALGVILYEMLALRLPYEARTLTELKNSVLAGPPPSPAEAAPGRRVPPELSEIAMRCLEPDPARRYSTAGELAADIERWIEGVARWQTVAEIDFSKQPDGEPAGWTSHGGAWRVRDGCLLQEQPGEGHLLWDRPLPGAVQVELEAMVAPGQTGEISLRLAGSPPVPGVSRSQYQGYFLQFGAESNSRTKLSRNDLDIAVADRRYVPGRWYTVAAELVDGRMSLSIDGVETLAWHDLFPLPGTLIGLYSWSTGLRVRRIKVSSRGTSARVSCLAVPAAFYNRGMLAEAREEYRRVAACQAGREEGLEALFLQGRCCIELARSRPEAGREPLLAEARACFDRIERSFMAPLGCLGKSMILAERDDFAGEAAELARAFRDYPGYEMLRRAGERLWERALAMRTSALVAEGQRFLRLAIEHQPEGLLSGEGLHLLTALLEPAEARDELTRAIERFAGNDAFVADARALLGSTLLLGGELDRAAEAYGLAIESLARRDPEQRLAAAIARLGLANVRYRQHRRAEAERLVEDTLADYPEQGEARVIAHVRRAVWRMMEGDVRAALEACGRTDDYLGRGGTFGLEAVALIRASAHLLLGENDSVIQTLRAADAPLIRAALDPDSAAARQWHATTEGKNRQGLFQMARGLLLAASGQRAEAVATLEGIYKASDHGEFVEAVRLVLAKLSQR